MITKVFISDGDTACLNKLLEKLLCVKTKFYDVYQEGPCSLKKITDAKQLIHLKVADQILCQEKSE